MNQYKIFYIKTICKVTKNIIKQRKCRWKSMGKTFQFKKFTIAQDRCAMKVGTDGVLLGAWARGGKRVLDIGTGTGLVALMMAQRFTDAVVDAVEIDHDTAGQAMENVSSSPFANRVKVLPRPCKTSSPTLHTTASSPTHPFSATACLRPILREQWQGTRWRCRLQTYWRLQRGILPRMVRYQPLYQPTAWNRSRKRLSCAECSRHACT